MQGKLVVLATQSRHKVMIEGLDAEFQCVTPMHSRRDKLVRDIIVCIKVFHDLGQFII